MNMIRTTARLLCVLAACSASPLYAQIGAAPRWTPVSWAAPVGYTHAGCDARGGPCARGCDCPRCRRWTTWTSADFLLGWGKGRGVPALVTTSPNGTAQAIAGELGQPTTSILFGNGKIGDGAQGGVRLDFGVWLDDVESIGLGATVWGFAGDTVNYANSSTGNPIIARPFFNVDFASQDAFLVAFPGVSTGSINVRATNDILGTDAYLRANAWFGQGYTVDVFGGYEFMRLDDDLRISSSSTVIGGGGLPVGSTIDIFDSFDAHNEFHGGVFGIVGDFHRGCWTLSLLAKVGIGNMNQRVSITGRTVTDTGGGPAVTNEGLLTRSSNIGQYSRSELAVIPEIGVTLGYAVTDYFDVTVGYRFTWWSDVVLSGDAVNLNVSPSQVTAQPTFTFRSAEYYLHSLSVGGTVRW